MIRSLDDIKKEESKSKPRRSNDRQPGGDRSGPPIETPDEVQSIMKRASENTRKQTDDPSSVGPDDLVLKISLYSNGFRVDDGDLRDYKSEDGQKFMKELNEGHIPEEIRASTAGRKVTVSLSDRQ
jgi:hypothetical protein